MIDKEKSEAAKKIIGERFKIMKNSEIKIVSEFEYVHYEFRELGWIKIEED